MDEPRLNPGGTAEYQLSIEFEGSLYNHVCPVIQSCETWTDVLQIPRAMQDIRDTTEVIFWNFS